MEINKKNREKKHKSNSTLKLWGFILINVTYIENKNIRSKLKIILNIKRL